MANMTPDPGIVTRGDAPSATPFDVPRTAWDQPAQIDFVSARGAVVIEPDPRADAILVPTPGTAALAALAGLVIILPRKRP